VGATEIGTLSTNGNTIVIALNSNANAGNIQTLIRGLQFTSSGDNPTAGTRTITLTLVDGDGNDGGLGNDTGTASATITVVAVNDAPSGADNGDSVTDNAVLTFTASDFSTGMTDPESHGFAGVKITTLPSTGTIKLNGTAIAAGDMITKAQLDANALTFEPAAGSAGTSPTFTFQVRDDGGTANSGVDMDQTANTFTIAITASNAAPVVDLDGDDSAAPGIGFASSYVEGGAAAIGDSDVTITDGDAGDDVISATITITNAVAGDLLSVGTLPATVTIDPSSTDTVVKLVAAAGTSAADFEAAIKAVQFDNTGNDPTAGGTNTSRTITVTVNDGTSESAAATATISVTGTNDSPDGTSAAITAVEDSFRILAAGDFGFTDPDSADSMSAVTITSVNGAGQLYYDADGTAGAGAPVAVASFPQTYTVAQLAAGMVSYRAPADSNGNALATIAFQVVDSAGAGNSTDPVENTLTVNVTAQNDTPVLTTGGPIAATEQTAVAILPAGSVADVDLDARNDGAGNYAGAEFSVNRNPATNTTEDVFTLVAGPNFTIDGSTLKSGGLIFGTINVNGSAGLIVITFTSQETIATSALVDEVIQSVRYTNTSDNPPASVDLAVGFTDGSPGGGQGSGPSGLDVNVVTVEIAGVNDAPVNSLGETISTDEDTAVELTGMSISDPDADPATDKMYITFQVANGGLTFRFDVPGGITAGDVIAEAANGDTFTLFATLNQINATLSAENGLVYTPKADFNGDDTLTVYTYDQGFNGTDPGLTGDGTGEEGVATRTITVGAQPDAPVAQNDAVSTPENVIGTGSLFADNGSGPDSDADGDSFVITQITVGNQTYAPGTVIDLPSGRQADRQRRRHLQLRSQRQVQPAHRQQLGSREHVHGRGHLQLHGHRWRHRHRHRYGEWSRRAGRLADGRRQRQHHHRHAAGGHVRGEPGRQRYDQRAGRQRHHLFRRRDDQRGQRHRRRGHRYDRPPGRL
jgi:hypothetical protein